MDGSLLISHTSGNTLKRLTGLCIYRECQKSIHILRDVIAESGREGTRAETRIGLSAKRTSPFKSAGEGGVSSVDYWQSRSADE